MKLSKDIVLEYMQNQALNHSESISLQLRNFQMHYRCNVLI